MKCEPVCIDDLARLSDSRGMKLRLGKDEFTDQKNVQSTGSKDERRSGVHGLLLLRAGNAEGQHEAPDGGGDDGEKATCMRGERMCTH